MVALADEHARGLPLLTPVRPRLRPLRSEAPALYDLGARHRARASCSKKEGDA
jgi:hypothetical protein